MKSTKAGARPKHEVGRLVGDLIKSLFPDGTRRQKRGAWNLCPTLPSDVYAAAALLLERSGAYSALRVKGGCPPIPMPTGPVLSIHSRDRNAARDVGCAWRTTRPTRAAQVPKEIQTWWAQLWGRRDDPLFADQSISDVPKWWASALWLLIASDEAAENAGYPPSKNEWFAQFVIWPAQVNYSDEQKSQDSYGRTVLATNTLWTICDRASPDVVCVLPKSRTAAVGNTLRSLSHNLALLPPRGLVEASWNPPISTPTFMGSSETPLNLLLLPFPYVVEARSFQAENISKARKIGWFSMNQTWLTDANLEPFVNFVVELVQCAERDATAVHGVVFPELALNWRYYEALRDRLLTACKDVELLIGGVSNYMVRQHSGGGELKELQGNFAITSRIIRRPNESPVYIEFAQPKHHRWRLEGRQIRQYGLGGALDPAFSWWEKIDLSRRKVDISTVRDGGTLTTLLCEDLARIDPSQSVLRAIGPNLVVALLMDGPQMGSRWSARGATVLAEDPGCSVLTLSSMGLVKRMNDATLRPPSTCIGLWRDDTGLLHELNLPNKHHAILITLSGSHKTEWTLDGRSDNDGALSWTLSGEIPLRISAPPGFLERD